MTVENLLDAVGLEWKTPPGPMRSARKLLERERMLRAAHAVSGKHLPEYLDVGGMSVVDFSCGNGALLETLRHHGLRVLGVDLQYFDFLESQGIPYVDHDCRNLPYPVPYRSHDIVTCVGAITFYHGTNWTDVLNEFGRIARRCVLVAPNTGHVLDENAHKLDEWCPAGWTRASAGPSWWKWTRGPR